MEKTQYQFRKTLMASMIASASIAGLSAPAFAQDVEEVLVTGVRASLERAMDVKRNAPGVVDAISSEDIGKMPDSNLAESLQRITGISINRTDGEGSRVTARGIGAELNMVTLNGRVMPAVSADNTGDASTRAFDFANLASESVSGIEVYKTGRADVATGGLGATVNIKTVRPLEAGDRATVGVKVINDNTVRTAAGDRYTPEASGLFSWANDDNTLGVALVGSFQRRDSSNANNFVNRWDTFAWEDSRIDDFNNLNGSANITNKPNAGDLYSLPTDLRYEVQDNRRDRTNAQLVVQFKPVEQVTATLDYTYSGLDRDSERRQQSVWFNTNAIKNLTFDDGAVRTPVIYHEVYDDGRYGAKDVSFAAGRQETNTDNNSLGFNLAYEVNDQLNLGLDFHKSSARNVTQGLEIGMNANVVTEEYVDWSYEMPLMSVAINDNFVRERYKDGVLTHTPYYNGNGNGIVDGGDISGAMSNNPRSHSRTEIEQVRLYGDFKFNGTGFFENAGVAFGIEQRKDTNYSRASGDSRQGVGNWDGVDPSLFPDQYFTSRDFGKDFPDFGSTTGNDLFFVGVEADLSKIVEVVEALNATKSQYSAVGVLGGNPTYSGDFYDFVNGKVQWHGVYNTNRVVEEESTSAYGQFNSNFDLGGKNANLLLGLRYEDTDVKSSSLVNAPLYLWWQGDNDWGVDYASEKSAQYGKGSYDYWLPSVDFDIEIVEDVKLRASASKTIGRPGYGDLRPDVALGNLYNRTATAGDTNLKPMESTNVDLSAEWYYSEGSYVSLGYFRKDVDGFIGSQVFEETAYGLLDARLGALAIASGINQANEQALYDYVFANSPASHKKNQTWVRAQDGDPLLVWDVTRPINDKSSVIDGWEFAVQHWFGETGFGVQANYTLVDADVGFDNLTTEGQFAMTGLSDTANLTGIYENDNWQVRIAYNWRDEFLQSRTYGGGNEPQYVEDFSQIDVSIGYNISENLSLSLDGINVTGENYRSHGRSQAQLLTLEDLGSRYQLGLRYTF